MTEPTICVHPVQRTNCTIDEALFFLTPEFIDGGNCCAQTVIDLVAALHWQREQIHRYRKLQRNQVEICMEALKDRDSALEILELLGAKP